MLQAKWHNLAQQAGITAALTCCSSSASRWSGSTSSSCFAGAPLAVVGTCAIARAAAAAAAASACSAAVAAASAWASSSCWRLCSSSLECRDTRRLLRRCSKDRRLSRGQGDGGSRHDDQLVQKGHSVQQMRKEAGGRMQTWSAACCLLPAAWLPARHPPRCQGLGRPRLERACCPQLPHPSPSHHGRRPLPQLPWRLQLPPPWPPRACAAAARPPTAGRWVAPAQASVWANSDRAVSGRARHEEFHNTGAWGRGPAMHTPRQLLARPCWQQTAVAPGAV